MSFTTEAMKTGNVQIYVDVIIHTVKEQFNPVYVTVLITLAVTIYWIVRTPLNRVRDMTNVGFDHLKNEAKKRGLKLKDLVNEVRSRRKIGELPPVYPNGWFALLESRDLNPGNVKPIAALGENFVAYRTLAGVVYVLDAYCPHLGAHLGVGGLVKDNCIECPFHGWQFDGRDGACKNIPYAAKVPGFAKIKKWQVLETNGFIFIWFHAENVEPTWYPPKIPGFEEGRWSYRGRTEHHVSCFIEDISENGGDMSHLPQVHTSPIMSGVNIETMRDKLWSCFAKHIWDASWQECSPPEEHVATLNMKHSMMFFNKLSILNANVTAKQIGPALVHLCFETQFGNFIIIQTVLPVGPLQMKMIHHLYSPHHMLRLYTKLVLWGEAVMVERDIAIWNSKTYMLKPLLVKEDRLLSKHRRWYSQFFSENSLRFSFNKNGMDW